MIYSCFILFWVIGSILTNMVLTVYMDNFECWNHGWRRKFATLAITFGILAPVYLIVMLTYNFCIWFYKGMTE